MAGLTVAEQSSAILGEARRFDGRPLWPLDFSRHRRFFARWALRWCGFTDLNSAMNNIMPKISVIMPSYNTASLIGEALDSVFAQSYRDVEVIVINDGSPDTPDLERILEPYRGRIVYLKQENRRACG